MKKTILVVLMLATCLYGCAPNVDDMEERNQNNNSQFKVKEELSKFVFLVEDEVTGCNYIQSQSTSLYYHYSPYYDENGEVLGCNGLE